jgi:hypothetical protein
MVKFSALFAEKIIDVYRFFSIENPSGVARWGGDGLAF